MTLRGKVLYSHRQAKMGLAETECEDRFAANPSGSAFAVSDGATESIFSGRWAEALATHFVEMPTADLVDIVKEARKDFFAKLRMDELPWHALAKLQQGTFATLLGVRVASGELHDGVLAVSLGDSCLGYMIRDEERFFPQTSAEDFNSRPFLVGTLAAGDEETFGMLHELFVAETPVVLFLMTDALAAWCFRNLAEKPLATIRRLLDAGEFGAWAADRISSGEIRNDDVTVLLVEADKEGGHGDSDVADAL